MSKEEGYAEAARLLERNIRNVRKMGESKDIVAKKLMPYLDELVQKEKDGTLSSKDLNDIILGRRND